MVEEEGEDGSKFNEKMGAGQQLLVDTETGNVRH